MNTAAFALVLLGALTGGFVSGLVGFGTAMTALGIWLYVLPPSLATKTPLARYSSTSRSPGSSTSLS